MAQRLQFGHQLLEVVDLAVEHDDDAAVFVVQRLLAGRQVDDRQPAMAEPDAGLEVQSAFIGAAVELRLVHAIEQRAIDFAPGPAVEYAVRFRTRSIVPAVTAE